MWSTSMLRVLLQSFSRLLGKEPMPTLSAGTTAPTFQLSTTTGERLSLPQGLAEGPVLLAFFKVSCPTCQFTFPFLDRIYRQLREQGVQVWGIVQDNAQDGARFASTFGVTFPILVDDSPYKVSRSYGLTHVPSLFLVQQDGRIEIFSEGFGKADLLNIQRSLAQSLSATPPALFLPTEKIPEYKPG
jgi:peroxiredoxin